MNIYNWLIIIFWLVFIAYWLISALDKKKVIKRPVGRGWLWGRLAIFVFVILMFQIPALRQSAFPQTSAVLALGTVLCALGILFAIWARRHLGRNWNVAPSVQENHELVTSGPYKYVRHPIYTGMLLAILGSALVSGPGWIIVFVAVTLMFVGRVYTEEKIMLQLFPQTYPQYQKHTKKLIPFIW